MQDPNIVSQIELIIRKDSNTEKKIILSQCDYSFNNDYYSDEKKPMDVNFSGTTKMVNDPLFIEWISNQEGEWSGSAKVYHRNQEDASIVLEFNNATVVSFSQSFSEYNAHSDAYFSMILKGVSFNNVKLQ
ncbi:type VI secretion system tube protein TssD [Winogradskyella vidalii]|uniref:type VI secretion system tube protein TssD n=1 Tax=Winogradskyella vidalii TaxID=2615024 RepID=UPI0015CA7B34|nr:type VI secretion system tube protein TssD [Winogradskyella vidalii]